MAQFLLKNKENVIFELTKYRKSRIPRFGARTQKDLLINRYGSGPPDFLRNSEPWTQGRPYRAKMAKYARGLFKSSFWQCCDQIQELKKTESIGRNGNVSRKTKCWACWPRRKANRGAQKRVLPCFEVQLKIKKWQKEPASWTTGRKTICLAFSGCQKEP